VVKDDQSIHVLT